MPSKLIAILMLGTAAVAQSQDRPGVASDAPAAHADHAAHAAFASPRISVEVVGQGPDVILIPGLGSSPAVWRDTVAAVPGYRYHLIQVKGFAGVPAEANEDGPVVSPVADEIARYISEQHLDRPALVGHSMGGTWAMLVATRHPEAVSRVMVVDMLPCLGAMLGGPGATVDQIEPAAAALRQQSLAQTEEQRNGYLERFVGGMLRNQSRLPEAMSDAKASDPNVTAQAYYDLLTTDLRAQLARFTGPLSVLWVVPTGAPVSEEMMGLFYQTSFAAAPNKTITHIPNSAHFIMWDVPDRFHRELRNFLSPNGGAPTTGTPR